MEREGPRIFSIEPYVESSGVMGERLEVNEAAAASVMKQTALRRDFAVTKGYGREARQIEGSEELAISTARVQNQHERSEVGSSELSDLIRNPDNWVLYVHDQQIGDNVNEWMDRHFKAGNGKGGQEVFAQKFAQDFGKEVVRGVRSAFWNEKKIIVVRSTLHSGLALLPAGVLSYMFYLLGNDVARFSNGEFPTEYLEEMTIIFKCSVLVFSAAFLAGVFKAREEYNDPFLEKWEYFLPNFSVPSIILGNASLLLNSGKLIRLKQS